MVVEIALRVLSEQGFRKRVTQHQRERCNKKRTVKTDCLCSMSVSEKSPSQEGDLGGG